MLDEKLTEALGAFIQCQVVSSLSEEAIKYQRTGAGYGGSKLAVRHMTELGSSILTGAA